MRTDDLESRLLTAGDRWPVPSVVDAVLERLDHDPLPLPKPRPRRAPWFVGGSVLAASLALAAGLFVLAGRPTTLAAQVRQSLARAATAHLKITNHSPDGVQQAEVWFSRQHGLSVIAPNQVLFDDGRAQWSWNPADAADNPLVVKRLSRDALAMIEGLLSIDSAPADESATPLPEQDRAIHGQPCSAVAYARPAVTNERVIVWAHDRRIHALRAEVRLDDAWQPRREIAIAYDVPAPPEAFVLNLPAGARVVDADRLWEDRFPAKSALASVQAGGLLFIVHEAMPLDDGSVYVVSSVRGTPEHLRAHPPQRRRVNLETSLLDVAGQPQAPMSDSTCHRAVLSVVDHEGVQYAWWIQAPRSWRADEVRNAPMLEIALGANYRDPTLGGDFITATARVARPAPESNAKLLDVARRVRRDALLGATDGSGRLLGAVNQQMETSIHDPARITDEAYAQEIASQLAWLCAFDAPAAGDSAPGDLGSGSAPATTPTASPGP